jgi:hypothetical protein
VQENSSTSFVLLEGEAAVDSGVVTLRAPLHQIAHAEVTLVTIVKSIFATNQLDITSNTHKNQGPKSRRGSEGLEVTRHDEQHA